MAKTKPDVKAHAKKSVATNAMFDRAGREAPRKEESRYMKDAIKRPTKASKSIKEYKRKHMAKHIPEHPLATEFAGSIEQSRGVIEEKVLAVLDAAYLALSQRLVDSHDLFNQREQDAIEVNDAIANPLQEQELEWTSTDGKQSGKTTLGVRMKKFQKTVEAEEKEFERQFDEWTRVQTEFRHFASLIVGPDGLDNLLAGNFDPATFIDAEQREMMEEIEVEQKLFMKQIEQAGSEAMKAMTESEKAMAPIALAPFQTNSELAGIKHIVTNTAPSVVANGNSDPSINELDASKLVFTRNLSPHAVPEPDSPEVWTQSVCTDHMVTCQWTSTGGWAAPHLQPYGPLQLMPTASVLHYATECFEGLKLHRGHDLRLRLFRPNRNTRRRLNSATQISLPAFDPDELQKLIETLVAVDGEKWLPKSRPGNFLYLRPTMIATAAALGMQKPKEALLYIVACCFPSFDTPSGTAGPSDHGIRHSSKAKPGLKLLASKEDTVRPWPGGFGYAKVGANYGPSLIAQGEAKSIGFDQVLWLLGKDCNVTEAGASTFFVVWRTGEGKLQLVTPPLNDKIILDGVTRRSVLELARERLGGELEFVERKYTMSEVENAVKEGRLLEAFAAGTVFFIAPVSSIHFRGQDLQIPMSEGVTGKYAAILKTYLTNIMYGREDHEWGIVINERQFDA